MIPFPFNENRFSFFVADHLLVGQLCTNPKTIASTLAGLPRITGTCSEWWKQSFRLRLWSLVWFQVRATSCHITTSKSARKSTPKCSWMCWRVWWSPGAIRWPVADPVCGSRTSFGITSRTVLTWPPTTPKPAWSPPSTEYSPSSCRRLWKRHAPSSGSVSRRWLRLKAATLNRCQLYYIIKLPELIFSIKVLK